jgi:hypothetical protein
VAIGYLSTRTDPLTAGGDPGTGDFAAFFTGAVLVREGRGEDLYDFTAQKAVQDAFMGEDLAAWQPYINPPGLAIALAPVTRLGYPASFLVFTGGQFFLLLAALAYLRGGTPRLSRSWLSTATWNLLALCFLPVALTTFGGQNTTLSFSLFAGIFGALRRGKPMLAGLFLGVLTFKPQYTLLLGLVLLARRELRVVSVAAAIGLAHYGIAAAICGIRWPLDFLAALGTHGTLEMAHNAAWHISVPAAIYRLTPEWGGRPATVIVAAIVLSLLLRSGLRLSTGSKRFPAFFGMMVAGTLLASPHVQYYEAGLFLLPALFGLETLLDQGRIPSLRIRCLLALGYVGFPAWRLSEPLGFQPLLAALLASFLWLRKLALASDRESEFP